MKTVPITIDEKLLTQIDELARRQGLDRSTLISETLRQVFHGGPVRRLQEEAVATYVAQPSVTDSLEGESVIQNELSPDLAMQLEHLFPGRKLEEVVTELLLEHTERQLVAFRHAASQFEAKYAESFDAFRVRILDSEPDEATEQDYFDWEMAITAADDLSSDR